MPTVNILVSLSDQAMNYTGCESIPEGVRPRSHVFWYRKKLGFRTRGQEMRPKVRFIQKEAWHNMNSVNISKWWGRYWKKVFNKNKGTVHRKREWEANIIHNSPPHQQGLHPQIHPISGWKYFLNEEFQKVPQKKNWTWHARETIYIAFALY